MEIEVIAVAVATLAGLVLSGAWYALLGDRLARPDEADAGGVERGGGATLAVELGRNLVVALVLAGLVDRVDGAEGDWLAALGLGLALWVAFPVVLLAGSVFHERVPVRLAAIHGGDWLLKLAAGSLVLGLWP